MNRIPLVTVDKRHAGPVFVKTLFFCWGLWRAHPALKVATNQQVVMSAQGEGKATETLHRDNVLHVPEVSYCLLVMAHWYSTGCVSSVP
jgi:hypothetical protein